MYTNSNTNYVSLTVCDIMKPVEVRAVIHASLFIGIRLCPAVKYTTMYTEYGTLSDH